MRRDDASPQEAISTHPIGRLLAIPARGARGRKMALAGYGMLVATVFGTFATTTLRDAPVRARDSRPDTAHGTKKGDVFTDSKGPGYAPTYLDGGGGIAGVPLTEEQRKALIREAMRRGMATADAYALAYGDNATIRVNKDGTVSVHTGEVVVPNGPVYVKNPTNSRKPARSNAKAMGEDKKAPTGGQAAPQRGEEQSGAQEPAKGQTKRQGATTGTDESASSSTAEEPSKKTDKAPSAGTTSVDPYYPSTGENLYEDEGSLKEALPPTLEKVVDGVNDFTNWLSASSAKTPQTFSLVGNGGNRLMMHVEAPLADDLTLTTTVTAAMDSESSVEPEVTSVVTDTETGAVLADETDTCPSEHVVDAVAIGQAVDVMLEAGVAV
jgi:hypothetical protein